MVAAFVYHPPARSVAGANRRVSVRLGRHPDNVEAAAVMGVHGYRSIQRLADGTAVVHFERFGRDPEELRVRLAEELRTLTTARILDD